MEIPSPAVGLFAISCLDCLETKNGKAFNVQLTAVSSSSSTTSTSGRVGRFRGRRRSIGFYCLLKPKNENVVLKELICRVSDRSYTTPTMTSAIGKAAAPVSRRRAFRGTSRITARAGVYVQRRSDRVRRDSYRVSCFAIDEIAIEGELPNERVDLAECHGHRQAAFEIPTEKAIRRHAEIQRRFGGLVHDGRAVFLREGEHAEHAADAGGAFVLVTVGTTALMCTPAVVARASSATVLDGVRAGRSSSWRRCQPRRASPQRMRREIRSSPLHRHD